ncbi:hypothetical protein HPP92_000256 [Vanilla planifolia]|uniref:Uncharacterized protein n=1 Tax=Vanilla planifolia TaxID=51239 RepID=A0A835VGU9_VANPL|nr:hypothetical protein HPP92_000256 [Vanilla planifolia]
MEDSASRRRAHRSLPSYWRRRACRRLGDAGAARRKPVKAVRLGGGGRRWSWRVARPVVRLVRERMPAPMKMVTRLRDAYVDTMVVLAGGLSAKKGGGGGRGAGWGLWDRRIPRAREDGLGWSADFEKRLMLHLYNSVIATR